MATIHQTIHIPWPKRERRVIHPFFIPYLGCKARCVFCAQHTITGESGEDPIDRLKPLVMQLRARRALGLPPPELAFYGGTFTALPEDILRICAKTAQALIKAQLICAWRISTRPDALSAARLSLLRTFGCTTVELGVQSFFDEPLEFSRRGYTGRIAREGICRVKDLGFACGVQLLPGMPGSTPAIFLDDVKTAIGLGADMLRFYPCLVFPKTELARLWARGEYAPWDMETTLETLSYGYRFAQCAHIPVIRMGLSLDRSGQESLLAGPWDPALGSRVMARALLSCVRELLPKAPFDLLAPLWVQGFFFGRGRELARAWEALGLVSARFEDREDLILTLSPKKNV
ncbi:MAG: radical SAM protein [Desulfovibrionaceae bacterium]|nr:radical SAM protein [Desulfovibrionaceae bacterium]